MAYARRVYRVSCRNQQPALFGNKQNTVDFVDNYDSTTKEPVLSDDLSDVLVTKLVSGRYASSICP